CQDTSPPPGQRTGPCTMSSMNLPNRTPYSFFIEAPTTAFSTLSLHDALPICTAPNVTGRVVALVSASVFDAVNGIEPRFRPLYVRPDAPPNASQRAAAIQAAYAILLNLYPAQSATLTNQRNASVAALAATETANSIAAGIAWGQSVADAIWAWRLTDGFAPTPPPFFGVQSIAGTPNSLGFWRPTPPANASGATPQLA